MLLGLLDRSSFGTLTEGTELGELLRAESGPVLGSALGTLCEPTEGTALLVRLGPGVGVRDGPKLGMLPGPIDALEFGTIVGRTEGEIGELLLASLGKLEG